jgi:DNA-3-methyladenine glycosylase II
MGDAKGVAHLRKADPVMRKLIDEHGKPRPARRTGRDDHYGALVRSIVGQQLSTKAARTIYARLAALIAAEGQALREAGLSRQKIRYLRDLATRVHGGELDLHVLHELTDDEVSEKITAVKGLGRWSADMFKSITAAYAG